MNRRDSDKEGGQKTKSRFSVSQNTDAQGTRAPATSVHVLCGLQVGIRFDLS